MSKTNGVGNAAHAIASEVSTSEAFATVSQAAKFLNLCRASIYNLMDRKVIPFVQIGSIRRIPWPALRGMLDKAMSNPPQHQ